MRLICRCSRRPAAADAERERNAGEECSPACSPILTAAAVAAHRSPTQAKGFQAAILPSSPALEAQARQILRLSPGVYSRALSCKISTKT